LSERAARRARLESDPSIRPHGDKYTYNNWGCRCDECASAWAQWMREWRASEAVSNDA
jgi:hypothetical protein